MNNGNKNKYLNKRINNEIIYIKKLINKSIIK